MRKLKLRPPELTPAQRDVISEGGNDAVRLVADLLMRQAQAHRATRRRWRLSYHRAFGHEVGKMSVSMEKSIDKAKSDAALAYRHLEDKIKRDNGLLAAEVTHVRLRFTQRKLSRRWMLVTQFDDNFMQYSRNLHGATEVIVRQLTGDMIRYLTQLDFSRMKPVDFDADRHPIYEMKFFQEGKDPWS